jgi:hypothetical protein
MTQRDDGHDYRDSKNRAEAYERNKKINNQAYDLFDIFCKYLDDYTLDEFLDSNAKPTKEGKKLLEDIKKNLKYNDKTRP